MNNEQRSRAAERSAAQIEAARVRFEQYVKRLEPGMRNNAPNLKRDEAYAVIAFSLFLACEELQAERDEARIELEQLRAEQRAVKPMPANQAKKEMPQFVGFTQTALDRHAGRIAAVAAASMADERAAFEAAEREYGYDRDTDIARRAFADGWQARAAASPAAEAIPQPAQADAQRKALQRAIDHAVMSDREDEEEALRALLAALEGGAA
ncbi:hypothetical protein QZN29_11100 [Burkholderia multivorans]|uniref:hypothetical protein n=1 Tax=Burkholderia multivorans TaxID=87883 RepID=UPI0021C21990|nr:hypothetical protein [Burkholderia multivorans]MDN8092104.1 hypothetical protein [Burkholderia multivorans]MDN8097417.1 hypothetical protein [Burkholderia multivorans]MDN8109061.1 hypothetical protein [Burkholderia multivorans]MDN8125119.1 hypothetical protein [Burkholderia multivorans]MDN8132333.1 hypothetical protein [Burkholderia multivorans]